MCHVDGGGSGAWVGRLSLSMYVYVVCDDMRGGEVLEGEVANMCQCNETHRNTPNFAYLFCGILPLLFSR